MNKDRIEKAHKINFKKSVEPKKMDECKGYNFSKPFNFKEFIDSFYYTGFQATNLGIAIKIVRKMIKEKATIFFGFTSNVASCGLREILTYLAKNKLVDVMVTTTGGIEEDVMKTHGSFLIGTFYTDDVKLRENGINRTGNLFIPNERYIWHEKFMTKLLQKLWLKQKKTGKIFSTTNITREIGKELKRYPNHETSYVYWAYKNNIPVFCPGLTDGAIGDNIFFFMQKYPGFRVDIAQDIVEINNLAINSEKAGAIIIGGSLPKHHIMNACLMRDGADYTVYLNTGFHEEGSNAGAPVEEAQSWGKASAKWNHVKVWGEVSITLPLLIAGAFRKKN